MSLSPSIVEVYPHSFSATIKIPEGTRLYSTSNYGNNNPTNFNIYICEKSNYQYASEWGWQDCLSFIGIGMRIGTSFYLNKDFYFNIQPLKPNTEYILYTNDLIPNEANYDQYRIASFTTKNAVTEFNTIYEEYSVNIPSRINPSFKYVGHNGLTFEEKAENAEKFREYLTEYGWSESAIAGVLGAFYCLGDMNPFYRIPFILFDNSRFPNNMQKYNYFLTTYKGFLTNDIDSNPDYWNNNIDNEQPNGTWGLSSFWTNRGFSSAWRKPIGFAGILGIGNSGIYTDCNLLYFYHFDKNVFPENQWLTGEYQIQYLNYEAFANLNWRTTISSETITYSDYMHFKGDPQRAAELFATHHLNLKTSGSPLNYDEETRQIFECIKQWAAYFYKPTKKKHKMPLWEYLRYTI